MQAQTASVPARALRRHLRTADPRRRQDRRTQKGVLLFLVESGLASTKESLETFVLVQGISAISLNTMAAAATIAAAVVVGRKEGLLGPVRA